jgi:lysophospholipase L1-like esterase
MKIIFGFLLIISQVTIYSQNEQAKMDWPNLQKYAETNKDLTSKQPNIKRVVLMGDSITEFWETNDPEFFAKTGYIDRGISGQTTQQMLLRFRQDVINLKPYVAVILAGINDIAENTGPIALEDTMGNIISMAELAKANKIRVVLCSVLPANAFWWNEKVLPADKVIALNVMIKDYAKKNNITYIDYYSPMVNDQKGLDKKWADDGVHPNLTGYRLMEPLLEKAVTTVLKIKSK